MKSIKTPRDLPKMDELLNLGSMQKLIEKFGRQAVLAVSRQELDKLRNKLLTQSEAVELSAIVSEIKKELELRFTPDLRPVLNASGTILHTNLGRAPLAASVAKRVAEIAASYNTLEYDLKSGERGFRTTSIENKLKELYAVEAALVVNNNAAGVMLALASIARGKEVIVSRGELVEIGGSFRVPEIMSESGAHLVEVGTTNKTKASDYSRAINEETAAILKVHRSNFLLQGFTSEASLDELHKVAHENKLPLIYDLGSGLVADSLAKIIPTEPTLKEALAAEVDLVLFSGDKLFGGPQAGIILGRKELIDKMKSHPLLRAFRCDKMTLAALEACLLLYANPDLAEKEIPLLRMASMDIAALKERSKDLVEELSKANIDAKLVKSGSVLGGGSSPGIELDSYNIVVKPKANQSAQALETKLRQASTPVIARIDHDQLHFDLRTIKVEDDEKLTQILKAVLSEE